MSVAVPSRPCEPLFDFADLVGQERADVWNLRRIGQGIRQMGSQRSQRPCLRSRSGTSKRSNVVQKSLRVLSRRMGLLWNNPGTGRLSRDMDATNKRNAQSCFCYSGACNRCSIERNERIASAVWCAIFPATQSVANPNIETYWPTKPGVTLTSIAGGKVQGPCLVR